jgi:hypothetical protein
VNQLPQRWRVHPFEGIIACYLCTVELLCDLGAQLFENVVKRLPVLNRPLCPSPRPPHQIPHLNTPSTAIILPTAYNVNPSRPFRESNRLGPTRVQGSCFGRTRYGRHERCRGNGGGDVGATVGDGGRRWERRWRFAPPPHSESHSLVEY